MTYAFLSVFVFITEAFVSICVYYRGICQYLCSLPRHLSVFVFITKAFVSICVYYQGICQYLCLLPRHLSVLVFTGAQWLSGRVLDSRPKGRGFEPHRRHCVVSLSKTHLSLLSTGSTQEDPSRITERLLSGRKE